MSSRTGREAEQAGSQIATGFFITFEGPEGGGKSTQLTHLAARLEAAGLPVTTTREPGGTPAAERIREVLLDPNSGSLRPETEAFLVCAARSEHVARVIRPALASGQVVLCDRFADATLAYQGYGGGVPLALLDRMIMLATDGLEPGLTLLLDLPVEVGLARRRHTGIQWTRLDAASEEFHQKVRHGYHVLARKAPARWVTVDAARKPEAVAAAVWAAVAERLAEARPALSGPGRTA